MTTIDRDELPAFVGLVCYAAGEYEFTAELLETVVIRLGSEGPWDHEAVARLALEQVWSAIGRPDVEAWGFERRLSHCVDSMRKFLQVPYEQRIQFRGMFLKPAARAN